MYNELVKKMSEAQSPFQPMGDEERKSIGSREKAVFIEKCKTDRVFMFKALRDILVEKDVETTQNDTDSLYDIFADGVVGWNKIDDAEVQEHIEDLYEANFYGGYMGDSGDDDKAKTFDEKALALIAKFKHFYGDGY